ncbi:transposase IS3/IS911 family protein [Segniliparus rotundus DSM 44985]|uniref:Transposase IS3/IS911 family protein n=1 Tax=Segniliparus rotundus (strain ATCC BAA-972 / CDC 1076 / CIP 108378 / DSM 44985 / JCM 13578) TaxID=640132 RepID=D6ZDH7_SEGRD|nr:helix-turn-helix domain-containing protein [Segniliparus rotundus]ADG97241.1 transposase IS3/IS911 family protein [Segniliparus rotundus DSM 44985]
MAQTGSWREFSERELAGFRVFAAESLRKTKTDFAQAQHERKLTNARAEHFRFSAIAAKLFEQLADPLLSVEARQRLWVELGEPDPARPQIGRAALRAAARFDTARRRRAPRRAHEAPARAQDARRVAVQLRLVDRIPAKELAERFSVTPQTIHLWVRNHLKQQGAYEPRRRPGAPEPVKAEAARLAIAGSHSVAQLAEKYGYHPSTVARWVREHRSRAGIARPARPKVPDKVRLKTLGLIFEQGLPPTIAARQCGVSSNTAHLWAARHAAEHDVPIPKYDRSPRQRYPPELKAEAVRLVFCAARTVPQAALALAVPVATVRNWAEEHQRETGAAMPGLAAITKEIRERAARAHHEHGVPIEEIAEQLHVLPRTVKTWAYAYAPAKEVPLAPRPAPRRQRKSS